MAKGQLPKAYLRIDPNLDHTHPDPGLFVKLLCAGARQPRRGLFKDQAVFNGCLGKKAAEKLLARGDVLVKDDGSVLIDGWDIWQEGDLTVGERMRRYREKDRNSTVTPTVTEPSLGRIPASEALGVRQETVETENGTDSAAKPRRTWLTPYVEAWTEAYGGKPNSGEIASRFRPLEDQHGPGDVLSRWVRYLAETEARFASPTRFASTFGSWAVPIPGTALARAAGASALSPRAETRRAAMVAAITGGLKGDGTLGGNES